jgi:hypothetical protein
MHSVRDGSSTNTSRSSRLGVLYAVSSEREEIVLAVGGHFQLIYHQWVVLFETTISVADGRVEVGSALSLLGKIGTSFTDS